MGKERLKITAVGPRPCVSHAAVQYLGTQSLRGLVKVLEYRVEVEFTIDRENWSGTEGVCLTLLAFPTLILQSLIVLIFRGTICIL